MRRRCRASPGSSGRPRRDHGVGFGADLLDDLAPAAHQARLSRGHGRAQHGGNLFQLVPEDVVQIDHARLLRAQAGEGEVHAIQRLVQIGQALGTKIALGAAALVGQRVAVVRDHPAFAGPRPDRVDRHVARDDGGPAAGRTIAAKLAAVERGQHVDERALHEVFVLGVSCCPRVDAQRCRPSSERILVCRGQRHPAVHVSSALTCRLPLCELAGGPVRRARAAAKRKGRASWCRLRLPTTSRCFLGYGSLVGRSPIWSNKKDDLKYDYGPAPSRD